MRFDAHCHVFESLESLNSKIILMSCKQTDWHRVIDAYKRHPQLIIPALGLHPWETEFDLELLEQMLGDNPRCIVGEIGLDKHRKHQNQVSQFTSQLALAIKLNRPVSIHCVKMYGSLMDILSSQKPSIPIMFHSYLGSLETLRMLRRSNLNYYISFGNLSQKDTDACIEQCPIDRILVESDVHECRNICPELDKIIAKISVIKNLSTDQIIQITHTNTLRFLSH
jgi:TatD DNase family protein